MALFDFKGFFTKNKEDYQSEASNSFSLNERRVEFNEQESEEALNQRKLKSFIANMDESSLFNLLNGETGGPGGAFGEGFFSGEGSIQKQVWQYFTSAGYSKAATAGIMGNIEGESSFNVTAENEIGAYGLAQWLKERRVALQKHAASMGLKESDLEAQLSYMKHEIETGSGWLSPNIFYPRKHTVQAFKTTTDPVYAAEAFAESFERMSPSEYRESYSARTNAAKKYYEEFKNLAPIMGGSGQGTGRFIQPNIGVMTSPFGPRWGTFHSGIDIDDNQGGIHRNVVAADSGVVYVVEDHGSVGLGRHVRIDHGVIGGKKITTHYGHLESYRVSVGQRVDQGQILGIRGNTGNSTAEHLHFEVHEDGKAVDPLKYVSYERA